MLDGLADYRAYCAAQGLVMSPLWSEPKPAAASADGPRVLKKYPNRRLYDTDASAYITLAEVRQLVMDGESFVVSDAKTGEDLTRSILMQIIIRELERMYIRKIYNIVKRFNGWDKKYPGLEFIIPATVLTTLDTGGSSKPVNTGGIDPKQTNNGSDPNSSGS